MAGVIPTNFLSLQVAGHRCRPYYFGDGGKRIGLVEMDLCRVGHEDDNLWVHPDVFVALERVREDIMDHGYDIVIHDAWRSVALCKLLLEKHRQANLGTLELMSQKSFPHATGLAVDAILFCPQTEKEIWLRDHPKHGNASTKYGFYANAKDPDGQRYDRLQKLLVRTFHNHGFRLGAKQEYWHFEHWTLRDETPRFWR